GDRPARGRRDRGARAAAVRADAPREHRPAAPLRAARATRGQRVGLIRIDSTLLGTSPRWTRVECVVSLLRSGHSTGSGGKTRMDGETPQPTTRAEELRAFLLLAVVMVP